ncbi:hypothetical protein [Acinetobacter sp. YH01009]|uniref:hypothetical protein n=1 Tax=Acinetobacter TaxID=469 RepID=UPI0015D2A41C|nr:hypothetical protein [Acinetobacter sp. YH01009]
MPYIIFLIFLAFATAIAVTSDQLNFDLYLPILALAILLGQISIFCFTSGATLLKGGNKRTGSKNIHYGISLSLVVLTSIYYLYSSVLDPKLNNITAIYIFGSWFAITSFDACFKFVKVGLLNSKSDSHNVVKATRVVSAVTLILCLVSCFLFFQFFLNIDLKIDL